MMVLRHIGLSSAAVMVGSSHLRSSEDVDDAPIDLSTKMIRSGSSGGCSNVGMDGSRPSVKSPSSFHVVHPAMTPPNSSHSPNSPSRFSNSPRSDATRLLYQSRGLGCDVRWREAQIIGNDEENSSYSSPDSGLQRDSPGEDEDGGGGHKSRSPPLSSLRQNHLIPLSLIRARYNTNHGPRTTTTSTTENGSSGSSSVGGIEDSAPTDHVQTKRARLEEMVSHIKQSSKPIKDRPHRHSGDDDTSSGDHAMSSDELPEEGPRDLRSLSLRLAEGPPGGVGVNGNVNPMEGTEEEYPDEDEPFNLACSKGNPSPPGTSQFELWKLRESAKALQQLSPSEAAKMYAVEPEAYQQHMMQLQLTSAAMFGDPGSMLKAMGNYPPWVYLGYYSQLLQSYQAQEILRQYAIQSQSSTPPVSQGEKSPSALHTLGSSGYNCGSPMSPASLSEGPNGMDSDGSVVGQGTSGSANGKRAPRAMTGRHVRTGTGASPATLKTLREKIEERQRLKAQQMRQGVLVIQNHSGKGKPQKVPKKGKK